MSTTEITWVCCPAGVTDGRLQIAVVVVPRLDADGEESQFDGFAELADWPAVLAGTIWTVGFTGGPDPVTATRVGTADSALWRAVFPPTLPVRPLGRDDGRADLAVLTYPVAQVAGMVRDGYADAAADETDDAPVLASDALGDAFELGSLELFRTDLLQGLAAARSGAAGRNPADRGLVQVKVPGAGGSAAVAEAYAFQHAVTAPSRDVVPPPPPLDVHQVLTLLGDHPALLRRLGLVVDLSVPLDGVSAAVSGVRVTGSLPSGPTHVTPTTALAVSADLAGVRVPARDVAVTTGVWPVDRPEYHLESLDVDSAVRKGVAASSADAVSADAGPPVLRNDGIALVQTGRAEALRTRLVDVRTRRTASRAVDATDAPLQVEDLLRGFRVDVQDTADGLFRSLHARRIRYRVDGFGDLPSADGFVEDEGFFQESLTGDTELFVHEKLVTWRGWSLSVPRPDATRKPVVSTPDERGQTLASLHTRLLSQVQPGTLPRLRFGHTYRLRLRTVDLAGGSLPVDAAPATTTEALTYRRYEPVPPPVPVTGGAAAVYPPGETDTRLVIREPLASDAGALIFGALPPSERVLLPPRSTLVLAEHHGVFDAAMGVGRERGVRAARRALVPTIDEPIGLPVGDAVPYLPDPQARGVAFLGLPGTAPGEVLQVDFPVVTPGTLAPIRLRLETPNQFLPDGSNPSAPVWDEAARVLHVYLATGQRATVRISSVLRDPTLMALWHEAGTRREGAARVSVESRVAEGRHTLVTPYAQLELVHATPTATSGVLVTVDAARAPGESAARLTGTVQLDPATTEALELRATWPEEVDRGPDGLPATLIRAATLMSWRLPPDAASILPLVAGDVSQRRTLAVDTDAMGLPRPDVGSTGHRTLTVRPATTTAFTDCYPPGSVDVETGGPVVIELPATIPPPPPAVHDVVPSQIIYPQTVERSDDAARIAAAAFPSGDEPPPDQLPGDPGWTLASQLRLGGGIRVYLDRPWFVSGSGELLGVVVGDPSLSQQPVPGAQPGHWAYNADNPVTHWISQVGQDPIRLTAGVQPLTPADFPGGPVTLAISALSDAAAAGVLLPVTVLGYTPLFEVASGRWYADIRVNADKAYLSFFRLAVVRCQPSALSEATSISTVTTLDVIQPLPNRTLSVVRHGQDPEVRITLRGTTHLELDARLQQRVSVSLYTADSAAAERWHPVDGFQDIDLPRPLRPVPLDVAVVAGALPEAVDWWTASLTLPPAPPGQVQRLLVVEHDLLHSPVDTSGPGSRRVVHVGTIDL